MSSANPSSGSQKRLTGKHVLLMLIGFFGLVMSVNAVFVYIAVTGFSGIETEDAYVKGLAYNETLAAAEAQKALGWRVNLDTEGLGGDALQVVAEFRDRQGYPLNDLSINVELRRPTNEGFDQRTSLSLEGEGRYLSTVALPLKGQWDLYLVAENAKGDKYHLEQRLWQK